MARVWGLLGALAGFLGVAMAAYRAHGGFTPEHAELFARASEITLWHAPVLLFLGLWRERKGRWLVDAAGAAIALGVVLFAGAVAALALGRISHATLAPYGGSLLLLGWALIAVARLRG
jgi:uncharacterized membrane protein YgdD (TMEM256/DUF423 family)